MPSPFCVWPASARLAPNEQVRGDAGERRLRLLEIAEHRVAEDRLAVAGLAARSASPASGPGAARLTSRAGSGTGSGCSSIWLNSEKIAAFAPMPSASDTIATIVTNGVLNSVRSANLRLGIMVNE